jgi:hypothetical protein
MLRRMLSSFGKLAMGASRSRGAIPQLLHPCTMESQLESTRKRSNAIRNSGAAPHVWLPRLPGLDYRKPLGNGDTRHRSSPPGKRLTEPWGALSVEGILLPGEHSVLLYSPSCKPKESFDVGI